MPSCSSSLVRALVGAVGLLISATGLAVEEIRFDRLTMSEGLSQSSVVDIAQCDDGFIWFATQYGLDRFDGYNIRSFRHDPSDPNTLNHSLITNLMTARDGRMWVTTERGLNLFDTQSGHAESFSMAGADLAAEGSALGEIIVEHPDGRLFLSSGGRIRIWRPDTRQVHRIPFAALVEPHQFADRSSALDHQGRFWSFNGKGLWRLNEASAQMDLVMPLEQDPEFRLFNAMSITAEGALALAAEDVFLLVDPGSLEVLERLTLEDVGGVDERFDGVMTTDDGFIWLPSPSRLLRYQPSDGSMTVFYDQGRLAPTENARQSLSLKKHPNGDLWFSSQYGLARLQAETGNIRFLGHDPSDPFSIPQTVPQVPIALFIDRQGLIWVGTNLGGVGWHSPDSARFRHIRDASPPTRSSIPFAGQNVVRGITETELDGQVDLWLALDRAGIRRLRLDGSNRFQWYRSYHAEGEAPFKLSGNDVRSLVADPERQVIWALSTEHLSVIDIRSDAVIAEYPLSLVLGMATHGQVLRLSRDGQSLWLGTVQGVWQLNLTAWPAQIPQAATRHLPTLRVGDLIEMPTGHWAAVGFEGFGLMIPNQIERDLFISTSELHPERDSPLHSIVAHPDDGWWIGGREIGLAHLRFSGSSGGPRKVEVDWFDRSDGLVDDTIYAILPEPDGNLWLSSNSGLMKWNPRSGQVRHFTPLDGVQALEFNRAVAHIGIRGDFFFGGVNGINRFKPERFRALMPPPRLHMLDVLVNGESVDFVDSDSITLSLAHHENDLEVRFVGLHFSDPGRVRYAYKLEGVDSDWIDSGNRRAARYASLPPGDYQFYLRAANNDGVWSDEQVLLRAAVGPPAWATAWALALYGLLFLVASGLTYGGFLRRRRALEAEVDSRTAALTEQQALVGRQARELEQALEARTVLFANVSHEFRTPLTLIKASLDRIEREGSSPEVLATGRRYLRRLLRLVDQLMDFSRLSYEQHESPGEPWPMGRMVRLTVDAFSQVALERGVELLPDVEPGWRTRCDQEQIEKILLNLLTNALKFTPSGGQIRVGLSGSEQGVELSVADSGAGIPDTEMETIFERFYRVPASEAGAVDGAGIGLALVKEAALANGGQVSVESQHGVGSRFVVSLPAWRDEKGAAGPMVLLTHGERTREIESLLPAAQGSKGRATDEPPSTRPRVLIVEDNADMHAYLDEILVDSWRVEHASDGKEGLETARANPPDVIVSDIMMPNMDGFEMLQRLRDDVQTSHIPIMLLTARRDRDTRVRGFSLSADDVLAKPFDPTEFAARLGAMLENRARVRELLRSQFVSGAALGAENPGLAEGDISTRDRDLLKRVQAWLEENYQDPGINVTDMADAALVDLRTLQRKLKSLLDRTPAAYLQEFRLNKARTLLCENGRAIKDVAASCGFSSAQAFTKVFRQAEGMPPSHWRQGQMARKRS